MTETDKFSEDVKRGTNRFSKHIKLFSGLSCESLEKSKKERIKKLSAVNRASTEMSADVAFDNKEQELNSSDKKFKLPRKMLLDDCNVVDPASVPRKLRSAMKKRGRESISPPFPDSKKANQSSGCADLSTGDLKIYKQNVKKGNRNLYEKAQTCGPITKDEEEVIEALYNLAGMFSGNEPRDEINNSESSKKYKVEGSENISAFEEHADKPQLQATMEVEVNVKDDFSSINHLKSHEAAHPASTKQRSPEKNIQVMSLNEMIVHESVDRCSSQNRHGESDSSLTPLNLPNTLAKYDEQKSICNSVNISSMPTAYQNTANLMQLAKLETLPLNVKADIALGQTTLVGSQLPRPLIIDESNRTAASSTVLNGSIHHRLLSQSSASKIPGWLDTLSANRPGTNGPLMGKISKVNTDRRSWKRSAYHVFISHLTQVFKVQAGNDGIELHQDQLKPHDIMAQGVLMTMNDFNGVKNGLNGAPAASEKVDTLDINSNEARNRIFHNQKFQKSQLKPAPASGMYTSQKQDFNFLSLSTGGTETETKNGIFAAAKGLVPPAQFQLPLINHVSHSARTPFSMPQASSNPSFPDQHSPVTASAAHQARLQLPSYIGTPLRNPHAIPPEAKQQLHLQNAQQLWMTHLMPPYRTDGAATALTQHPVWQNGRQNLNPVAGCAQPITLPSSLSPASLEVLGPRYPHSSQQQQIIAMSSSLPHALVKNQGHHLSSIYEETGNVFQTGSSLPLQLLCNERM